MSNKRKKCRLLQNLYSIFLPNSKKRKKCRTKRKKCWLFKISIRHFFLNNKKRKKCRAIRHFFIDSFEQRLFSLEELFFSGMVVVFNTLMRRDSSLFPSPDPPILSCRDSRHTQQTAPVMMMILLKLMGWGIWEFYSSAPG